MPFLLPKSVNETERAALVLAFGRPSVLEASVVLGAAAAGLESRGERVCTVLMGQKLLSSVPRLAGIHKLAPILGRAGREGEGIHDFAARASEVAGEMTNLSLSAYGLEEADYEDLVRGLLDAFREQGRKKIHLLRPEGNELRAEQVSSRSALDVVAIPADKGFDLGLTSFVPDSAPLRERGTSKPAPRPEISLSPRLAKLLVNLTGLGPGQRLLDPFCGAGSILAEGVLQRLSCVGVDTSRKRINETRRNLAWLARAGARGSYRLMVGDARDLARLLGDTKVDAVATEPILLPELNSRLPFDTASGLVEEASTVYSEALASITEVLNPGGRVALVVPVVQTTDGNEVFVGIDGRALGLRPVQPGPISFQYPVRLSFESTRWLRRAVYLFVSS